MSAISVSDVCFEYNKSKILNKFCANIEYANIYALLGPSGCGKTTLLRLILGRIKAKRGSITILGQKPCLTNSCISYMPQDSSLCPQFTVSETLNYFARIYCITQDEFSRRLERLHGVLNIPNDNRIISELSGGEQRRVSLALTLLNNSKLVILDEPTVGIDLMITSRVWDFLFERCKEGLTVMFVTQYVEEATHADRVGFMRNGKLLVEGKPLALMNRYKENRLEKVFLKLCLIQDSNNDTNHLDIENDLLHSVDSFQPVKQNLRTSSKKQDVVTSFLILLILIQKNYSKIKRMGLPSLLIVILPAIQAIVFCLTFSKDLIQMKTAIVNEELDMDYSHEFLSSLTSVEQHIIEPVHYSTLNRALEGIEKSEVIAVIQFKSNFSYAIDERIENLLDFDNQTIDESSLHLYLDNSIITYANLFMTSLEICLHKFLSKLYEEKNLSIIETPIKVEKTEFTMNLLPKDYYLPGFMLHMLYFSLMITSSLSLILERKDGLFERSLIAGVSHELVFISHIITNFMLSLIQIFLMLFIIFVIFTNRFEGSIFLIISLFITKAINSISTGFLVSSLLYEEFNCLLIVASIAVPQFFSSGIIWPIESLNRPLRIFCYSCPLTLPTNALKDIMFKNFGLHNSSVFNAFSLSIIPSIFFIALALIMFKRK